MWYNKRVEVMGVCARYEHIRHTPITLKATIVSCSHHGMMMAFLFSKEIIMEKENMKPCPICDESRRIGTHKGDKDAHRAMCYRCGAFTDWYDTAASAVKAWNMAPRRRAKK